MTTNRNMFSVLLMIRSHLVTEVDKYLPCRLSLPWKRALDASASNTHRSQISCCQETSAVCRTNTFVTVCGFCSSVSVNILLSSGDSLTQVFEVDIFAKSKMLKHCPFWKSTAVFFNNLFSLLGVNDEWLDCSSLKCEMLNVSWAQSNNTWNVVTFLATNKKWRERERERVTAEQEQQKWGQN